MVNRTNHTKLAREIDKLTDKDTAVLSYQPQFSTSKNQFRDTVFNDDLIASLSDAYENRRARQVVEWERLYRQNVAV
ncbi:MAG: hypothetical protein ACK4S4_03850 [Pyrinomonadaceae bacterium]